MVAETTACADGVEIGTMTIRPSPANWRAICAAVAGLPCADSIEELEVLAFLVAGGRQRLP